MKPGEILSSNIEESIENIIYNVNKNSSYSRYMSLLSEATDTFFIGEEGSLLRKQALKFFLNSLEEEIRRVNAEIN